MSDFPSAGPRTRRRARAFAPLILPLALAAAGGCVPVPAWHRQSNGAPRPESLIGTGEAATPLVLGRSTRAEVLAVLGGPEALREDGRLWVYPYDVALLRLYSVIGMFGLHHDRLLLATFDDAGTLRGRRVVKDQWLTKGWPLPDEFPAGI